MEHNAHIIRFNYNILMMKAQGSSEMPASTRGMSKLSSDHLNFVHKGHEMVVHAHSYFANIPERVRHVLITVASSSSKLELLKYGKAH